MTEFWSQSTLTFLRSIFPGDPQKRLSQFATTAKESDYSRENELESLPSSMCFIISTCQPNPNSINRLLEIIDLRLNFLATTHFRYRGAQSHSCQFRRHLLSGAQMHNRFGLESSHFARKFPRLAIQSGARQVQATRKSHSELSKLLHSNRNFLRALIVSINYIHKRGEESVRVRH